MTSNETTQDLSQRLRKIAVGSPRVFCTDDIIRDPKTNRFARVVAHEESRSDFLFQLRDLLTGEIYFRYLRKSARFTVFSD